LRYLRHAFYGEVRSQMTADVRVIGAAGESAGAASGLPQKVSALLHAGDFAAAVRRLGQELQHSDDPEPRLLYGQLAHFACDFETARRELETAFAGFLSAGLVRRAAVAASSLARVYLDGWGNRVAGSGWLRRASRLLEGEPPCVEQGWVAIAVLGCGVPDAAALDASARLALDTARRFGDLYLEARALAESGLAFVSLGRIDEGMTRLDESLALALGPGLGDPVVICETGCCMLTACMRVGDLARAEALVQLAEARSLTHRHNDLENAACAAVYGALLREIGRWQDAERMLVTAVEASDRCGQFLMRLEAYAALAELRVQQGRLEDAERLLFGFDDRVEALVPLAQLYVARGDYDLAAAITRRGVRLLGADRVRAVPLLLAAVEAELGRGDLEAAAVRAAELTHTARQCRRPGALAQAALGAAKVAAALGQPADAVDALEAALVRLGSEQLPLLRAAIHCTLARVLGPGDRARAVAEARAAAALHTRAGAAVDAATALLLRELGVPLPDAAGTGAAEGAATTVVPASLRRDGAYWTVRYGEVSARLRDSKGMAYLAELLSRPGVERHVFDLVDMVEGVPTEAGLDRRHLGDAGPLIDAQAKDAYRRRLFQLREAMDDADACGDQLRAEQIQAEIDAIAAELARAMGLSGRDRRASCAAEKARLNVTRAVRSAISRIREAHPPLGEELGRHVRTGMFCSYQPGPGAGSAWTVDVPATAGATG
jgi:tetratricopeptide (TPR) repeat protein